MLLLLVILSIGNVTAFIPIVIIIILIIAAQGATGKDFFNIFGINTLIGMTGGINKGKSAGKGLAGGRYSTSRKETGDAIKDIAGKPADNRVSTRLGRTAVQVAKGSSATEAWKGSKVKEGITPFFGPIRQKGGQGQGVVGRFRMSNRKDKFETMEKMSPQDVKSMLVYYGHGKRIQGISDPGKLADFAADNVRLSLIMAYYDKNVKPRTPPGTPPPPTGPREKPSGIRYATGFGAIGPIDWYKGYFRSRFKGGKSYRRMGDALRGMSDNDLRSLLAANKIDATAMTRDQMVRSGMNRLNEKKINSWMEENRKNNPPGEPGFGRSGPNIPPGGGPYAGGGGATGWTSVSSSKFKVTEDNFHEYLGLDEKPQSLDAANSAWRSQVKKYRAGIVGDDPIAAEYVKRANVAHDYANQHADSLWGQKAKGSSPLAPKGTSTSQKADNSTQQQANKQSKRLGEGNSEK